MKSSTHGTSWRLSGRAASRRDNASTLSTIWLTRRAFTPNDIGQAVLVLAHARRFREQLPCVAHRAERIADLVRDAGAQAPERGELGLLNALRNQRRVLEKDHDAAVAAAGKRREVRLNVRAVRRAERHLRSIDARAAAPTAQLGRELGRHGREVDIARLSSGRQLLDGGLVDQADVILAVDDDDTLAQMLDDVVVELDEVAQIDATLLGERLALD